MTNFLSLPREVRDMVYRLCLIVDFTIIPHPTDEERRKASLKSTPDSLSLLKVCKQIYAESRIVLYSGNEWQLPITFEQGNLFGLVGYHMFRKVAIRLSGEDRLMDGPKQCWIPRSGSQSTKEVLLRAQTYGVLFDSQLTVSQATALGNIIDEDCFSGAYEAWFRKFEILWLMTQVTQLRINIESLSRYLAIHRRQALELLDNRLLHHYTSRVSNLFAQGPPRILFEGVRKKNKWEMGMISKYGEIYIDLRREARREASRLEFEAHLANFSRNPLEPWEIRNWSAPPKEHNYKRYPAADDIDSDGALEALFEMSPTHLTTQ